MPAPEQIARTTIDAMLAAAGWTVQDTKELNLSASQGVAVREMQSQGGPADYILFVDGKALGVVEAKKEGTTLSGVAEQSQRYTAAKKWIPQCWADPLPFTYETTGIETNFRDQRDPDSRSRPVFAFHTPEHLLELVQQQDTLRGRLKQFPELNTAPLRDCQIEAITKLEKSLSENRPARPSPDGHRLRQDLHRRHPGLPPHQARRGQAHPLPSRPRKPRTPDREGVPEFHHRRRRA